MQIITKKQFNKRISQTKKSFYSRLGKSLSFKTTVPKILYVFFLKVFAKYDPQKIPFKIVVCYLSVL